MKDQSFGVIPVQRKNGELLFLLIQHHAGHWAFPKGHAENGETDIEAARRELREETDVAEATLLPDLALQETYYFKRNQQTVTKTVRYFVGLLKDVTVHIQAAEVRAYQWVGFQDALNAITFSESRRILTEAYNYLEGHSQQISELFAQISILKSPSAGHRPVCRR